MYSMTIDKSFFVAVGWWPPDPDTIPPPDGMCSHCFTKPAMRVCNTCLRNFIPKTFCFSCWAEVHKDRELVDHSFSQVQNTAAAGLVCVQCSAPATRKCLGCDGDAYCSPFPRKESLESERHLRIVSLYLLLDKFQNVFETGLKILRQAWQILCGCTKRVRLILVPSQNNIMLKYVSS